MAFGNIISIIVSMSQLFNNSALWWKVFLSLQGRKACPKIAPYGMNAEHVNMKQGARASQTTSKAMMLRTKHKLDFVLYCNKLLGQANVSLLSDTSSNNINN